MACSVEIASSYPRETTKPIEFRFRALLLGNDLELVELLRT